MDETTQLIIAALMGVVALGWLLQRAVMKYVRRRSNATRATLTIGGGKPVRR